MSGSRAELDKISTRLRDGDSDAFAWYVSEFTNTLLCRAQTVMANSEAAQEVVQRALVRIWKRHANLPDNWGALCAYSLKVVTNLGLDTIRDNALRARREAESGRQSPIDNDSDPAWAIMAREAWGFVMELPVPLRDVMLLRFGQGLTIREAADELETSAETVSVRQRKALAMLREKLDVSTSGV